MVFGVGNYAFYILSQVTKSHYTSYILERSLLTLHTFLILF